MRIIQDDLECHIMYCGEPTIDCCLQSIENQTMQPSKIVVIEDVTPINESINERHRNMFLPYSVKVDADCILYKGCFRKLYEKLITKGTEYYAVSCLTLDPFVGKEGGIHMERTEHLRNLVVPNIIGCDRFIKDEMERKGLKQWEMPIVLAEHWSDWDWKQVFRKSMRIGQKHLYYKATRHNWIRNHGKQWLNEKNNTAFIAMMGYCYGLLTPDDKEKGPDFAQDELAIVYNLIRYGVIPSPDSILTMSKDKQKRVPKKNWKPPKRKKKKK